MFGFYLHLGVYGVWVGSNIGSVLIVALMIHEMNKINFKVLCEEVHARVEAEATLIHSSNPTKTDAAV